MKGIVFTEFLEMVENKFSPEIADKIIEASTLSTDGSYTSVGTYHHSELLEMVTHLSKESGVEIIELVKVFGDYLFGRLVELYPEIIKQTTSSFDFLESVDNHIHIEVQKLYPEAELPTFKTSRPAEDSLKMEYQSERPFAPLAEGMIKACIAYHNEDIDIKITDLSHGENKHVEFLLKKPAVKIE